MEPRTVGRDVRALVQQARLAADDLYTLAGDMARDFWPKPGDEADAVIDLMRSRWWTAGPQTGIRQQAEDDLEFARLAREEISAISTWPMVLNAGMAGQSSEADPLLIERLDSLVIECERRTARLRR